MYDVIVVGGGPAGITAAIYCARKRLKTILLTENLGGQVAFSSEVCNYPGFCDISGIELVNRFEEHLGKNELEVRTGKDALVVDVEKKGSVFEVKTEKKTFQGKTVIIASGARSRKLGVPGEEQFRGKGLTYCATCDAPLFSGKTVAVVGGGNSAMDAALQLIRIAKKSYMIDIAPELKADPLIKDKILGSGKVEVFNEAAVLEVFGNKFVKGIKIDQQGIEKTLAVEGVFVEIGYMPNSEFLRVEKNERGEIKIDKCCQTSIPGLFAAGDVTDVPEKQIIVAAGEGAKAALSAFVYLSRMK